MDTTAVVTPNGRYIECEFSDEATTTIVKLTPEESETFERQLAEASKRPNTFTVFAVYEEDLQAYATTVEAESDEQAIELAQAEADEGNGTHVPLAGFQVVRGAIKVIA